MPHEAPLPSPDTYDVLGIPVSVTNLSSASALIHSWAGDDVGRFVCIRDVHGVMQAYDNPELARLHHEAAMVTPDGMPLVWLGKRAGLPVDRTCGPDLIDQVMRDSAVSGLRHYVYGGKEGVAARLREVFETRYPGVEIVGHGAPPFRELTDAELAQLANQLNASGAEVIWLGLSTPKQEFLMKRLAPFVTGTLIGVGAAFDYHTGAVKRAPKWMQRSGIEFLHRLCSEPQRLWRRYLIMAPRFAWHIIVNAHRQ